MAVYLLIVYAVSRPFGAAAQAGFGIGMRIVQAGFLPVVALGFAVAPVAGQNFGARKPDRVRATFTSAAAMAASIMLALAVLCHVLPETLIGTFADDPNVIRVGVEYLQIVSWTFIGSGVVFVASSTFQAMGNTIPPLITSAGRLLVVAVPTVLLTQLPGFELRWIWYLSAASIAFQLALNLLLLQREFRIRLRFEAAPAS
jgi:Na+-driven multidrug efflux pump